jgi:hypothetical protein
MLILRVEASAGADIRKEVLPEMCALANRIGCLIVADLNSVHSMVKPGADPDEAARLWDEALQRPYKIFCAHSTQDRGDEHGNGG